jgi:thymidylate kinase
VTGRPARRTLVAISGVDGAGKSSLIAAMVDRFAQRGVPVHVVWFRPGMGMGWVERPVRSAKRLLGQPPQPAMRDVDGARQLPSRKGVLGFVWCLLVTLTYLRHVRAQLRTPTPTIICDRYVLDAVVTLRVFYGDSLARLPIFLVRHLLPRPDLTLYLTVPVELALARKPGDTIGRSAVTRQVRAYEAEARRMHVCELTSTAPVDRVVEQAWSYLAPVHPAAAT